MFKFLLGVRTSPAEERCKDQCVGGQGTGSVVALTPSASALSPLQGFTLPGDSGGPWTDVSEAAFQL